MTMPVVLPLLENQEWLAVRGACVLDLRRGLRDPQALEALRRALEAGVVADRDPRRARFYEASISGHRYYFHLPPYDLKKALLLARWRDTLRGDPPVCLGRPGANH